MRFKESRQTLDFAVGLFVLIAGLLVVFIALRAANLTDVAREDGYSIRVQFEQIGSLSHRALVKSSGVQVGRVEEVRYNNSDFTAEVDLLINDGYRFPDDSIFAIESSNLLGGQYIAIEPGGSETNLSDGSVVSGNSAIVLEHLISKFLFEKAGEGE